MKQGLSLLQIGTILFISVFILLLPSRLAVESSVTFSNDSAHYHGGAVHIARSGFYSLDGIKPFKSREPGYSIFLGGLYTLFGEGNRIAIFVAQAILHLTALLIFLPELRKVSSEKAATICGLFLLLLPSIYHLIFTVYRESFTLSLFLLFAASLLMLLRKPTWTSALLGGSFLGSILLTYASFLFLPLLLLPLLWYLKVRTRFSFAVLGLPMIFLLFWGTRNAAQFGQFEILPTHRAAQIWSMRSVQAERLRPLDPFRCIWGEYIARDWSAIPQNLCRPEGFAHAQWFLDLPSTPEGHRARAREAQNRILHHLPNYLWQSLFWIAEYHFPYLNGWGFSYNLLASLTELIVYGGCILFFRNIRKHWQPPYLIFLTIILYSTAVFSLTQALPRYRTPTLFCYIVLASIGYSCFIAERGKDKGGLKAAKIST